MPSLFSRRKSEANLRASPSSGTIPSEPVPTSSFSKLLKGGGGRAPATSKTKSGARSKSVGRDGAEGRPERERAAGPLGGKGGKAPAVTLDLGVGERNAEDDGGWGGLDGKNQLSATSSGAPTPIAARFASPSAAGRGYDTPPRRDSSFASTFPTVSSVSAAFTSPPANLVASPSFFPSSPPTSDGGHDGLSLDAPALSTFKPASSRREREQTPASNNGISQTSDSPNSSFASPGFSPAVARLDRLDQPSQRAGLPPSSSFYNFGAAVSPVQSPAKSPPHPPRRESLMARRNGNESFPIVESEEGEVGVQDSPSVSRTRRAASQGVEAENLARESTRRREQTSPPAPARSAFQSISPSLSSAIALNALSSASSPDVSSSISRGAYNPLAAFFGTATANSTPSFASPALSASSSFGTPALSASFSPSASDAEGGEANAATPATSDGEDEDSPLTTPADEKPFSPIVQAKKPVLRPPIQLEPATRSRHSLQSSSATPTQADFLPSSTPLQAEKAAFSSSSPASLAHSSSASTKQQSSPVVAIPPRRESLPPLSPLRAAKKSESSGQASLAKAAPSSTTSLEQRKTVVDAAERSTAAASETATSSSLKKLPPSPLDPASLAASQASPSRSRNDFSPIAALSSPRTPRTPSTATSTSLKSPRALPASFNLDLEASPRKRITNEGTPRTMALRAARERQRREASEASEGSGEKADVSTVEVQKVVEEHSAVGVAEEELKREAEEQQEVEEEQDEEEVPLRPRVEYAFSLFAPALLHTLLHEISFIDLVSLRQVSRTIRRSIDEAEAKEVVLERFLGAQGYRRFEPVSASSPGKRRVVVPPSDTINLDIRDLLAFRAGLALPPDAYSVLARTYASSPPEHFSPTSLKLARATTRAWNRVVLRLRSQSLFPAETFAPPAFPALAPSPQPVYKTGRAASLRVWVPVSSQEGWMTDAEIVECEREIWRAGNGAWAQLRKGDIVTNVACEAFGNVGKLVFDGRYLRDLAFSFDVPWLNMLAFSPSYYHNIVVSSSCDPVFYLSLAPFVDSVRETIQLCSDRVGLSSPQGCYVVKRWVYRAGIKIKSGQLIGSTAGVGGSGPGGIDVVHDEWVGQLMLEADGTTEQATMLVARAASVEPTPWRIVRSKCRPGRLFLRPVLDSEAC